MLGGAKVHAEQPTIRVYHHHECDIREVVSFRQHLGAHKHARFAGVYLVQDALDAAFALRAVAIHSHHRCIRESRGKNVLRSLGALPNRFEGLTLALWALLGRRRLVVAVVASHRPVPAVVGQASVAARAFNHVAAVKAHHDRGKPSPIDENQRLLTFCQNLFDGIQGRAGEAALQWATPDIQQADDRGRSIAGALFKLYQMVFGLLCIMNGFQRRSGGSQNYGAFVQVCAVDGQVPAGVPKTFTLLVRAVVLFIDDDGSQVGER